MTAHFSMSMPTTFLDLVNASCLPASYQLPVEVSEGLSPEDSSMLMGNPLTPLSDSHPAYPAQRQLLQSIAEEPTTSHHLRLYCAGLYRLAPAAWDFIVQHGYPAYHKTQPAVKAGTITDMDAPAISNLYNHWLEVRYLAQPRPLRDPGCAHHQGMQPLVV